MVTEYKPPPDATHQGARHKFTFQKEIDGIVHEWDARQFASVWRKLDRHYKITDTRLFVPLEPEPNPENDIPRTVEDVW